MECHSGESGLRWNGEDIRRGGSSHGSEQVDQVVHGVSSCLWDEGICTMDQGSSSRTERWGLAELATQSADIAGLQVITPTPSLAGEDFAFYQKKVPGIFVFMGTSGTQEWHHPAFDLDERALPISANYFAILAEQALKQISSKFEVEVSG